MERCSPSDVALKSFFLGPQAENANWLTQQIHLILERWFEWRKHKFPNDGHAISPLDQDLAEFHLRQKNCEELLSRLISEFESELPKFSPRYIGHMFSEISMPALLGHILTLLHNPNNISGESSRAGVLIEDQAIQSLGKMIGFTSEVQGHFTSGGTIANFEALSRAVERTHQWGLLSWTLQKLGLSQKTFFEGSHCGWMEIERHLENPDVLKFYKENLLSWSNPYLKAKMIKDVFHTDYYGPIILVPEHKHYSWVKGAGLFGLGKEGLWPVSLDRSGRLCPSSLNRRILEAIKDQRPISLCVSVVGSTELGAVDPVHEIQNVIDQYKAEGLHLWHHVDAAFGGFFACLKASPTINTLTQMALENLRRIDSMTIDPHKMGYVPYASGAIIFKNTSDYKIPSYSGPYLQIEEKKDKGPHTLEGSRSAAGAVATWLTAKSIGLDEGGYGRILEKTIQARSYLQSKLQDIPSIRLCPSTDLNLLGFCVAKERDSFKTAGQRTEEIFKKLNAKGFYVSKTILMKDSYGDYLKEFGHQWSATGELEDLEVIRLCIMNPFFDSKEFSVSFPSEFAEILAKALL